MLVVLVPGAIPPRVLTDLPVAETYEPARLIRKAGSNEGGYGTGCVVGGRSEEHLEAAGWRPKLW